MIHISITGLNSKPLALLQRFAVVMLLAGLTSCDDFVQVDLPTSQLPADAVFEDRVTANAAMADIYADMRDTGLLNGGTTGISYLLGNYADELQFYGGASGAAWEFHNNVVLPSNATAQGWWTAAYNQIYAANAVIEGVAASQALAAADRDQFTGEALFVRAMLHFYLLNIYGDIPYITTTDYRLNRSVGRMATGQVYAAIVADLNAAAELLPEEYISSDRSRPNKYAALAMLARAYLYSGQWAEAADSASAVLNNVALYPWQEDLSQEFLKESTSAIWHFSPRAAGINALEGESFIFTEGPPPGSAVSEELMAAFEPGDQRRAQWIGTVTGGATWYYPNKYKERLPTDTSVEHSIMLRLSELYLIRAEARVRQGDLISGKEDLDKVRNRAGLAPTLADTQPELAEAILQERRVELFTELGHRFFDLKRMGMLDQYLSPVKPGWDTTEQLFPLPETELLLNPNLAPQNSGY